MVIWPLSPSKTQIIVYHVFPAEHFEQPDFKEKAKVYHDFLVDVLEEDREMVDSMQRGMTSRMFEPGPLSRMEVNLHGLINYNLDRTFDGA
jgi:phenylpropionate dioxygenase-like ring-hydroxylating dioxygenase large terminal subunit